MEALDPYQQALAATGMRYARRVAARYDNFTRHADDIESAAMLGVLIAASTYDEQSEWSYWLKQKVRWSIMDYVRRIKKQPEPLVSWQGEIERKPDPHEYLAQTDNADFIATALERLDERSLQMCKLVYFEGLSIIEASEAIGVSVRTGHTIHQAALKALAPILEQAA